MNLVDPKGLFEGERLAACSDLAQLHWQRLFSAANGYGRIELSYQPIIANVYRSFKKPPTEDDLWALFEEYATNFLAILYESDAAWWAQFATSEKYLPRYKTARDERSPAPPLELIERHRAGYIEWKKSKSFKNQRFQKFAEDLGNVKKISAAVVGVDEEVVAKQEKGEARGRATAPPLRPVLVSQSAGANGEFAAAYWLQQELGVPASSRDIEIFAQAILFASREYEGDVQATAEHLKSKAHEAELRGEKVDVFWFKDRNWKSSIRTNPEWESFKASGGVDD
jgi:hypothetical protein